MGRVNRRGPTPKYRRETPFSMLNHFIDNMTQLQNILVILYGFTIFPAKLCVLLQMMRVFKGTNKDSVYWAIQALIWTNFGFYVSQFFGFIFACRPQAKLMHPEIPGVCIDRNALLLTSSAINIVSDFSILLLPVFAVWKLQMTVQRKLGIAAVFAIGLL